MARKKTAHSHICKDCGTYYENLEENFGFHKNGREGRLAICRSCWSERSKKTYKKKGEKKANTKKRYTEEELIYLEKSWGTVPVKHIARTLKREPKAIKLKAFRMGLGSQLDNIEFLMKKDIADLLNVDMKTVGRYTKDEGLELVPNNIYEGRRRPILKIDIDNFIKWLEEKEQLINWSKVDRLGLVSIGFDSRELDRRISISTKKEQSRTLTDKDKERIIKMYTEFCRYEDIAKVLNKEYSTIKWFLHTCFESGEVVKNDLRGRLVRKINGREGYGWTEGQDKLLIKLFREGKTLREISEIVGKPLSTVKTRNQKLSKMIMQGKLCI